MRWHGFSSPSDQASRSASRTTSWLLASLSIAHIDGHRTKVDFVGTRHATENYGWLYISQGIGSIFGGPLAALMHQHASSWVPVFGTAITLDITTAVLAIAVLKPMRSRFLAAQRV